jgi:hypothetical protein
VIRLVQFELPPGTPPPTDKTTVRIDRCALLEFGSWEELLEAMDRQAELIAREKVANLP